MPTPPANMPVLKVFIVGNEVQKGKKEHGPIFLDAKLSLQSSELGKEMDTDLAQGQDVLC